VTEVGGRHFVGIRSAQEECGFKSTSYRYQRAVRDYFDDNGFVILADTPIFTRTPSKALRRFLQLIISATKKRWTQAGSLQRSDRAGPLLRQILRFPVRFFALKFVPVASLKSK
jgi:hypothetical protein